MNILIADDHPAILKTYDIYLRSEGHEVIIASTPEEAFEYLKQNAIDVGIIDFDFSGMLGELRNGMEVVMKARKIGITTPIIINTGYPGATEDSIGKLSEQEKRYLKPLRIYLKLSLESIRVAIAEVIKS
jgi:DNA-binding response OmpR family regulator